MAGVFWVGTKIVFMVGSRSLQMNDGPGSQNVLTFDMLNLRDETANAECVAK
jgi:hypothetical protein